MIHNSKLCGLVAHEVDKQNCNTWSLIPAASFNLLQKSSDYSHASNLFFMAFKYNEADLISAWNYGCVFQRDSWESLFLWISLNFSSRTSVLGHNIASKEPGFIGNAFWTQPFYFFSIHNHPMSLLSTLRILPPPSLTDRANYAIYLFRSMVCLSVRWVLQVPLSQTILYISRAQKTWQEDHLYKLGFL